MKGDIKQKVGQQQNKSKELFREDDLIIHAAYVKLIFSVVGLILVGVGCALVLDLFLGQGIGFIVVGLFFYLVTLVFELFKQYLKK
ncbi:MAG: hypothetical protein N3E37_01820 [Candidatus Micrarchaeota archaeon]|nr:hypothetical protein [Candidatus Micrarchaeota archaeon]